MHDETSPRPASESFPQKTYAATLLALVLMFFGLGVHVYSLNGTLRSFDTSIHIVSRIAGKMEHLDEALTMSARVAAATGDSFWKVRYYELAAELNRIIAKGLATSQSEQFSRFIEEIGHTNAELIAMEAQAFDFLDMGESEKAIVLLNSPHYLMLKKQYTTALQNLHDGIDSRSAEIMDQVAWRARVLLFILSIAIPILLILASYLLRLVQRYINQRDSALSALQDANDNLELKVAQSTLKLQSANARMEAMLDNMASGVVLYEPVNGGEDFIIRDCNPAVETIEGVRREDILNRPVSEVFPGLKEMGLWDAMLKTLKSGEPNFLPMRVYEDQERTGWRENHVSRLPSGEVLCVYEDITERIESENEIKQSEERFRTLFNSIYEAVFLHDLQGRVIDVNQPVLNMFGITREEALAGTVENDFSSQRNPLEKLPVIWQRARDGEELLFDWIAKRPHTGEEFDVEVFLRRVDFVEEEYILANVRDMTAHRETESRLARSEQRFHDVALTSGDWIWEVDAEGRYTYASGRVYELLGYTPQEMLQMTPFDLMPEDEAERILPVFKELASRGESIVDLENRFIAKDGREGVFLTSGVPMFDKTGRLKGYFGVDKDITRRKEDEQKLKLFEEVFNNAMEGITITDSEGAIVAVNPAFTEITGYEPEEALGENPSILKSDRHEKEFYSRMWSSLIDHGHWSGEIWNRRKDGEAFPEWLSISAIRNQHGDTTHFVAVFHDITEMKRKERQIAYQAYHDPLTGLPNRLLLLDRLQMGVAHLQRTGFMLGVLFIDLDNFKHVNDSLGHSAGDKLIQQVGEKFSAMMREEDTVARLGGDEFVIMIQDIEDHAPAVRLAERIITSFSSPFVVDGNELFVTPSIGITMAPQDGMLPEVLIKNADMAMYRAKDDGKNAYRLFAQEMNELVQRRIEIESALRRALVRDQFQVFFQPKVDLIERRVCGLEALVRWIRSTGEVVSPMEFIPLAEETGLILPLGEKVLIEACGRARELINAGHTDMQVSVNLSPKQFAERDLPAMVDEALRYSGLDASHLELEITETTIAKDIDDAVAKLTKLSEMGIKLAIDDFGTGYSSLYYLKRLPIDTLKIDGSFVRDLPDDANDATLVSTILMMAANLKLGVVAEGVENKAQLDFLNAHGCRVIQGYYFAKPMPFDELTTYLENFSIRPVNSDD